MPLLKLGTRGSPLAMAQAEEARRLLSEAHPELQAEDAVELVVIKTTGDRVLDRPLSEIGGKGLFVKEIEEALGDGRIDAAVHSMKDVPTWLPEAYAIEAVLPREDPRDAFFSPHGSSLADLPRGARVGSASLRRQSQIRHARPDLEVVNFRGNVQSRLRKLAEGEVDATLLALAGLKRLGREDLLQAVLPVEEMLPAAGQGAIGLECRSDDLRTIEYVRAIDDPRTSVRVTAERACLDVLEGSCRTPIAALADYTVEGNLNLRALVAEPDGSRMHRSEHQGAAADALNIGRAVGGELRAAAGEAFFEALRDLF
ncbi:hydroxymethylbilane synthase [Fodinicurvata halophila]|uniref:Porphobilinogen deaminase n=1 Tax=Fodinicurvata halophila TaxID=1419723 RepID=A0ABV8UN03_9PROT